MQRDGGSDPPAQRLAGDEHPLRIRTELHRVVRSPARRVHRVLERGGLEARPPGPAAHGEHHDTGMPAQRPAQVVRLVEPLGTGATPGQEHEQCGATP